MSVDKIAKDIGMALIAKYKDSCSSDTLDKECYEAVADIKADLYDKTKEYLEEKGFKLY